MRIIIFSIFAFIPLFGIYGQTNPAPFALANGNFSFTQWDSTSAPRTYPPHMAFHGLPSNDNDSTAVMTGDYKGVYDSNSRTRIKGLNQDGIMFVNTGNADSASGGLWLGAAVVALNTTGRAMINVSFEAQTMQENPRTYAWLLQYRTDSTQMWTTVQQNGQSVIYVGSTTGHTATFNNIILPNICNNKSYVQIRWLYHQHLPGSGARTWLRLDNISISSSISTSLEVQPKAANPLVLAPNPSQGELNVFSQTSIIALNIYDLNGRLLHQEFPNDVNARFNIAHLPAGLLICEVIRVDGSSKIEKLIKH